MKVWIPMLLLGACAPPSAPVRGDVPATAASEAVTPASAAPTPRAVLAPFHSPDGLLAIPLGCVIDGRALDAAACHAAISVGDAARLPSAGATHLGAPTEARCAANGAVAPAWVVPMGAGAVDLPWGTLGHAPSADAPLPAPTAPDTALLARAHAAVRDGMGWPFGPDDPSQVEVAVVWAGAEGRVLRLWRASPDPDKPGNGTLLLATADALHPLGAGLDWNGVVDLAAVLDAPDQRLLVIRSQWMGGEGLHVIALDGAAIRPLGEWVCGS